MITFTYTKKNGEVSERVAEIISSPQPNYFMFDLTDYSEAEREEFKQLHAEYVKARKELEMKFSAPMKMFKPEGISNVNILK